MTAYDDLLTWVSEVQSGSLSQLSRACASTSQRAGGSRHPLAVLDDLVALGHVSVLDGRWTVTPPHLVALSGGGGSGILIGSRPRWLVDALDRLDTGPTAAVRDLYDHVYESTRKTQQGPSTWFFAVGPEGDLGALDHLGIRRVADLAGRQLRALAGTAGGQRRSVRPGEVSARLAPAGSLMSRGPVWEPADTDAEPGCYRYVRNGQRVFAERLTDGWDEVDRRALVWRAAPREKNPLWFVPRARELYLPSTAPAPLDVERALVLRSGRLPERTIAPDVTGSRGIALRYQNITHDIASTVARLLDKELLTR